MHRGGPVPSLDRDGETSRRDAFGAHARARRPRFRGCWAAAIGLVLLLAGPCGAAGLQIEIDRLVHPAATIERLRLEMGAEGDPARVAARRIATGEHRWDEVELRCPKLRLRGATLECEAGRVAVPGLLGPAAIAFTADLANRSGEVALRPGGEGEAAAATVRADGRLEVRISSLDARRLADWIPDLAPWQPSGRLDARLDYVPGAAPRLAVAGRLAGAAFATADGLRAAEGLALDLDLDADARSGNWEWRGRAAWTAGEAYVHPLYLAGGAALAAAGRLTSDRLVVNRATLDMAGVRSIAAHGELDLGEWVLRRASVALGDADLGVIGPRYLAPVLAPAKAGQLRFAGRLSAGIEIEEGKPVALDLAFDDAGFALTGGELSFGPLSGALPWRAERASEANLSVGGGRWQKLGLGAFELKARLRGRELVVERVAIPVLDGALVLNDLVLRHEPTGWVGSGGAVVEPISMPLLTEAAGLPPMSGILAASLPGLRVAPGELRLDGALVVSVFDGYLQATKLRVLEPFGVASHLYADVEARHLDLAQLTETFSFGSITGFVDAEVQGLELARWRPVRFDARVASSPGSYPRRISQRAVQNIGALGGEGAVVAMQRSFLGFFETFGYREIGLSCVLADGICRMGGLGDEGGGPPGGGYYIVRGGGIPALNVIGYNRRVDWNELVDRLLRVIESNAAPVIQ